MTNAAKKVPRDVVKPRPAKQAAAPSPATEASAPAPDAPAPLPTTDAPPAPAGAREDGGNKREPVDLRKLESHPLAPLFDALAGGLEKLPADPRLTDLVLRLARLREDAEDLINGVPPRARPGDAPGGQQDRGDGERGAIPAGGARVRVTGPKAGRFRLGRRFGPEQSEPFEVTAEELEALKADPKLTVKVERAG